MRVLMGCFGCSLILLVTLLADRPIESFEMLLLRAEYERGRPSLIAVEVTSGYERQLSQALHIWESQIFADDTVRFVGTDTASEPGLYTLNLKTGSLERTATLDLAGINGYASVLWSDDGAWFVTVTYARPYVILHGVGPDDDSLQFISDSPDYFALWVQFVPNTHTLMYRTYGGTGFATIDLDRHETDELALAEADFVMLTQHGMIYQREYAIYHESQKLFEYDPNEWTLGGQVRLLGDILILPFRYPLFDIEKLVAVQLGRAGVLWETAVGARYERVIAVTEDRAIVSRTINRQHHLYRVNPETGDFGYIASFDSLNLDVVGVANESIWLMTVGEEGPHHFYRVQLDGSEVDNLTPPALPIQIYPRFFSEKWLVYGSSAVWLISTDGEHIQPFGSPDVAYWPLTWIHYPARKWQPVALLGVGGMCIVGGFLRKFRR